MYIQKFYKLKMLNQCYYQNVLYETVENQNLLKDKKQVEH